MHSALMACATGQHTSARILLPPWGCPQSAANLRPGAFEALDAVCRGNAKIAPPSLFLTL